MSEKIIKEFTFDAPVESYSIENSMLRKITSTYKGLSKIWVYVDVNTGKSPQFVSDGDLPDPTTTWQHRSVLLDSNNPNHVLLMDLLSTSRGHSKTEETTEQLNTPGEIVGATEFVFYYTDLEEPPANRYYNLDEIHVDENGKVTYKLDNFDVTPIKWGLTNTLNYEISNAELKLKDDPVVVESSAAVARLNRYIAVLTFARDTLLEREHPWKIVVPRIADV